MLPLSPSVAKPGQRPTETELMERNSRDEDYKYTDYKMNSATFLLS
jgi:hypothetical protein